MLGRTLFILLESHMSLGQILYKKKKTLIVDVDFGDLVACCGVLLCSAVVQLV